MYLILLDSVLILLLLGVSGLVSGSEVAFFSFSHQDIKHFRISEDVRERRISFLLDEPKKLLATILILNNLVNIFIITLGASIAWGMVKNESQNGIIIVILTFIITPLIIFFGEIIPKIYANKYGVVLARRTSKMLLLSGKFFRPFSWFLMSITGFIERKIKKKEYNLSVEEIKEAIKISVEKDRVSENEKGILKGIVNFGTLSVKQVMQSRIDIMAIDIHTDFHQMMDQINKTKYSRIPIYSKSIDKVEGILYIKDLLPHIKKDEHFEWQKLLKPAFFIPESKKIDDLFKDFQEKHVHIAIVIDEYGGTSGLITMEDVIEEIVGDINDESDDEETVFFKKIDTHTYIFEGKTSLNDLCKITRIDINRFDKIKGENESLGGLLLEIRSRLPKVGEKIYFDDFLFTVVAADRKRIKRVRVSLNQKVSD